MENNTNQWINWSDIDSTPKNENENQPHLQEEPTTNWEDQTWGEKSNDEVSFTLDTNESKMDYENDSPQNFDTFNENSVDRFYTRLGSSNKISINNDIFSLNLDTNKITSELNNLTLQPLDEPGRYIVDFSQGEELSKVILALKSIAKEYNTELQHCYVYSLEYKDKFLNISRNKPEYSFILYIKTSINGSQVILDLSSLGGPSLSLAPTTPGILNIYPGWIPYSLSSNDSEETCIAIGGSFK